MEATKKAAEPERKAVSPVPVAYVPRLFLIFGALFGLAFLVLIPPNQVVDERAHLVRAYSVSEGRSVPDFLTPVPQPVIQMMEWFRNVEDVDLAHRWITAEDLGYWLHKPPNQGRIENLSNGVANTYTGVPYLASGVAFAIARLVDLPPLALFDMGRLANLIVFLLLVYWSLQILPDFHLPLFGLALMPMTLVEAASLSADSVTLATSFLLIAYVLNLAFADTPRTLSWSEIAILTLLVLISALTKFNIWLVLLVLLIPQHKLRSRVNRYLLTALLLVLCCGAYAAWRAIDARNVEVFTVQDRLGGHHIDIRANAAWLVHHPRLFLADTWSSWQTFGRRYLTMFVGTFGWAQMPVPFSIALSYVAVLFAAVISQTTRVSLRMWQRLLLAIVFLGSLLSTFVLLFINETPLSYIKSQMPSISMVIGVQGRYFIPFALCLFLAASGRITRLSGRIMTSPRGCNVRDHECQRL